MEALLKAQKEKEGMGRKEQCPQEAVESLGQRQGSQDGQHAQKC